MIASEPASGGASIQGDLTRRLKAGDEEAFRTLLDLHGPRLLAVARRILKHEEDARDVLQDALLSVLRSLEEFKGESTPSTWVHRIVVNASLMKLRERRRRRTVPIERNGSAWDTVMDVTCDPRKQPSSPWTTCDWNELRVGMTQLREDYEAVIRMRYLEELPTEEIAFRMGTSTNAIRIRLHRARRALRSLVVA